MGEKNNPYFVVLMSCLSSWFHSKEVSNKVASAANFIQTQCIVSSGVHFSLCNSSLLVYKWTLQVFKCTDEALRVSYELHCLLVQESTSTKVALALEQKASLSEAKLPSSTFATLMYIVQHNSEKAFKKPWLSILCPNAPSNYKRPVLYNLEL